MSLFLDPDDAAAELFSIACDGELTDEQSARLNDLLMADRRLQTAYLKYFRLHADLRLQQHSLRVVELSRDMIAAESVQPAERAAPVIRLPRLKALLAEARLWLIQPATLSMLVSGLIITTILLSLSLWMLPPVQLQEAPDVTQIVAEVTTTQRATWHSDSDINFRNREIFAGERIHLVDGLAEVTFGNGAVTLLEGPTEFIVDHQGAGTVERGKLSARVPPRGVGFTIYTPTAEIVDLGTEFGVEVDPAGNTLAEVNEGLVEVQRIVDGRPTATMQVRAGQAATVAKGGQAVVPTSPKGNFVRTIPAADAAPSAPVSPPPSNKSIPLDVDTPALIDVVIDDGSMLGADAPNPANAGVFGTQGYIHPPLAVGGVSVRLVASPQPLTETPQTVRYRCVDANSGAEFSFDVRIECFTSAGGAITGGRSVGMGNGIGVASQLEGSERDVIDSDAVTTHRDEFEFVRLSLGNVVMHERGSLKRPLKAIGFTAVNINSREHPEAAGEVRTGGTQEVVGTWASGDYRQLIHFPQATMSIDVVPTGAVVTVHGIRVGFDLEEGD